MRWDIANQLSSQYQKPKSDSLEFFAREAFENEERAKFKMLHQQYYNDENLASPNFAVTTSYINCNTNIDSINCIKKTAFETKDNDLYAYTKNVNTIPVEAISNPFYSGCPLKAKSINYDIQKVANTALQNWAVKINADKANNHEMVSGCIIIAKNDGQILVSSSYPFLFNENKYHLKYVENNINERFDFKFKYYTVKDYINFSEYDQMPGSIVKPLLAYCGLKVLPSSNKNISSKNLNYFIGYSDPTIAFTLFKQLANINAIDTVKQLYKNDFSIMQFYDLNSDNVLTKDDKTLKSYAIGQQNKLTFKDIVQSYTRIKTGKKVLYTYDIPDTSRHFESISLADEKLKLLQTAMKYPLRNGTAANVGKEFKNMKINYSNYLAKTGTAQIADDPNHNKTSSFIIVTDKYTIGIQLFGDLPKNENLGGCSARHLFINLIKTLTDYGILQRVHK